ncbi:MAG: DUF4442 domain-containing protein [Flavobacteriales bacterium]|nr:DUF4442 domain-containing protein [Flavobacteriales bacterium]MEB2343051.1 DUF4442 domain-containing protein [Flavobacteriia bacterium]
MDLARIIERSRTSAFHRRVLNMGLARLIPFNRPHGFRVVPLPAGGIRVEVPFRRINRNHIRGIHACCLATAAEFCSGLALMTAVEPGRFRIIMKELRMEYHFQARSGTHAEFAPAKELLEERLVRPLMEGGPVLFVAEVPLHDSEGHHVATGTVTWQIKAWEQVRTRP